MAKNIHPKLRPVNFKFSQGKSLMITSAYKNTEFLLETDIFIHPAWRENERSVNLGSAKINKFNSYFGGSSPLGSFTSNKPKAETKE